MNDRVSLKLASYLLQIKAIEINVQNPFTWASGWLSPIYCDNRKILSYPEVRSFVKEQFMQLYKSEFKDADTIAGVATAGIPHGALLADALALPFVYVRSSAKGHGRKNVIEGDLKKGARVMVIEDVVSTGMSSLKAVDDLIEAGAQISGLAAIYTYGFPVAEDAVASRSLKFRALTNYDSLLESALDKGIISKEQMKVLDLWRQDPPNWRN